ncbi:hypothetical protein GSI_05742 [Ganoderma sinense ZZ0214-1]|uniref:LysM domain-containing protein n=1 Tax=Ganoderma sinense ZZ0214-1 TaxID=1077348 RepID=A0A2G8SBA9_9APHY|nr:hypothetical protein GSI_05742 [Ganoderma sinense ZZ0214-1]
MFARSAVAVAAAVLAAVCASVNVDAAATGSCARNYTVVAGDTCDGICAKENVSTFQLASVNNGTINADCSNLFAGEALCLGIVGQDCQVTHVVKSGDSCLSIAQAAGTTEEILLANNPNVNSQCTNLHSGEVLCTADDVIVVNSTVTSKA